MTEHDIRTSDTDKKCCNDECASDKIARRSSHLSHHGSSEGRLSATQNHCGHGDGHHHSPEMFRKKFWLSLLLTIPTLVFSPMVQSWLGYSVNFWGSQCIPVLSGIILFIYGGVTFLAAAKHEIAARRPGMMTLVSMAIITALVYSIAVTVGWVHGMDFWWELSSLITIMLLGHWLEMMAVQKSSSAVSELSQLLPDTAEVIHGSDLEVIALDDLKVGDIILVRPGGSIPVDGTVVDGLSSVDESMLTGEARSVHKGEGSLVTAGTVNEDGALRIRVERVGDDTTLSHIVQIVRQAEAHKSHTQVLADRAARYLFYVALIIALLTTIGWLVMGAPLEVILQRVVTVLVVACPHALGLAVPLVVSISTGLAARQGIIIRDRRDFEVAHRTNVVLFDKTGTLTTGYQTVAKVYGSRPEVLSLAATVEQYSEHAIAAAICRVAKSEKNIVKVGTATGFRALPGLGAQACVDNVETYVGNLTLASQQHCDNVVEFSSITTTNTVVYVIQNKHIIGAIELGDTLRDTSITTVRNLQRRGIFVAMVTGDSQAVAQEISQRLGGITIHAEVPPEGKSAIIERYQQQGRRVMFVGDGVNDAPALARADVGVAIGSGTDIAAESAGLILVSDDPLAIANIMRISRATYHKMIENLLWGAGYNVLVLPLAAGVLAPWGAILSPAIGAIFMSLSTVIVALNAQLLRWTKV